MGSFQRTKPTFRSTRLRLVPSGVGISMSEENLTPYQGNMQFAIVRLPSKGKLDIPVKVRKKLGLRTGGNSAMRRRTSKVQGQKTSQNA